MEQIFGDIEERLEFQTKIIVGGVDWYHATASFVDRIYLTELLGPFKAIERLTYPSSWLAGKNFIPFGAK